MQFEITPATRDAMQKWIKLAALKFEYFLFPSRIHNSPHLGARQYARILEGWGEELGLDPADYGTHSIRRTNATLIYRRTNNLRAMQLLLGHSKGHSKCATSASRSTMIWRSLNRPKSDRIPFVAVWPSGRRSGRRGWAALPAASVAWKAAPWQARELELPARSGHRRYCKEFSVMATKNADHHRQAFGVSPNCWPLTCSSR